MKSELINSVPNGKLTNHSTHSDKSGTIENQISCLVSIFIKEHNITTKNTLILDCMKKASSKQIQNMYDRINGKCDFDSIQKIFESVLDNKKRQQYGIVYTPINIVDYIVNETVKKNTKTVCDPACGMGVFLIRSVKRLHRITNRPISHIIENNIYGADVLDIHVKCTKILLILLMLLAGEDKKSVRFNIIKCNSLTFDWKQKFPEINDGFDVVVGNPPYIRIQDISTRDKADLQSRWKTCAGSYNMYFPFFELGIDIINKNGVLGYITNNSFFTSLSGKALRRWFQDNRYVRKILDFTHLVLFDATSYTCVIFLDQKNKDGLDYSYVESYNELEHLDKIKFDINYYDEINYEKWRLLKINERKIIKKIESAGSPLGHIAEIHSGVATLKDKIYLLPYSNSKYIEKIHGGKKYKIENNVTKDIIKIPDTNLNSINVKPTHKIIFPYEKINGIYKPIPETKLQKKYPKCYSYLCAVKDILMTRDKGKKNYETWYCYGRRQGLTLDNKKILTRTFCNKPHFVLDDGDALFCNGYAVHNTVIPLEVVQKILNSVIMQYYISKTSVFVEGGYACFQKNFIERFGIPELTSSEIKTILNFDAKDKNKIDKFLLKKYRINPLTH